MLIENQNSSWKSKHFVWNCHECGSGLGLVRWKHHCRGCGEVFCATCCSYLTKLSYNELCSKHPKRARSRKPQKCCFPCHERVERQALEEPTVNEHCKTLRGMLGVRVVDDRRESRQERSGKVFAIQVPDDGSMQPRQRVPVVLDGRRFTVVIPGYVEPGETFYAQIKGGELTLNDDPWDPSLESSITVRSVRLSDICDSSRGK